MLSKNHGAEKVREKAILFRTTKGFIVAIILLLFTLLISILFSIDTGVAGGDFEALMGTLMRFEDAGQIGSIMMDMRMPRALAACFTGAAFALAGALMQGITRNPLADSGLLGINAGASFMIALAAVVVPALSSLGSMLFAFLGALMAALMVFGFGMGKKGGAIRLILAGAAVSAFLTALSQGVALSFGLSKSIAFFTAGSLSGITWDQLTFTIPWICGASIFALVLSRQLTLLALGEESATGIGVNVLAVRFAGMALVLILAGASVSLVGGISFLGLIVPHISRLIVGSSYGRIMPVSLLLGAILLVLSDVAARMINAPFDTPVGALVAIFGVPVFIALTYRKKGVSL